MAGTRPAMPQFNADVQRGVAGPSCPTPGRASTTSAGEMTWMAGTRPAMTVLRKRFDRDGGRRFTAHWATNSSSSLPPEAKCTFWALAQPPNTSSTLTRRTGANLALNSSATLGSTTRLFSSAAIFWPSGV